HCLGYWMLVSRMYFFVFDYVPVDSSILFCFFFFYCSVPLRDLHSFPTRRSSDLGRAGSPGPRSRPRSAPAPAFLVRGGLEKLEQDRKSTRLNSSHRTISYAVFCLKKKNKNKLNVIHTTNYNI